MRTTPLASSAATSSCRLASASSRESAATVTMASNVNRCVVCCGGTLPIVINREAIV